VRGAESGVISGLLDCALHGPPSPPVCIVNAYCEPWLSYAAVR